MRNERWPKQLIHLRLAVSFVAVMLLGAAVCRAAVTIELSDTNWVDAVVHTSVITRFEVEISASELAAQIAQQYANDTVARDKKLNDLAADTLEQLVQRQLILHEFDTAGYSLPEGLVDQLVEERIRQAYSGDRVRLIRSLRAEGMTFEQFRKQLRDRFIIDQMRLKNISDATLISPHKIEVYYLDHTNDFKIEEQVKLRMIVLTNGAAQPPEQTRKLAGEILTKLDEGAPFAEMASTYSQGAQSKEGGEWGWVEKSVLRKELTDEAFKLKPGEKSGVIDTPQACYIMLVEDKRPAHIKPLNEVRSDIESTLLAQDRDRLLNQWVGRLKNKTFVRYF